MSNFEKLVHILAKMKKRRNEIGLVKDGKLRKCYKLKPIRTELVNQIVKRRRLVRIDE